MKENETRTRWSKHKIAIVTLVGVLSTLIICFGFMVYLVGRATYEQTLQH